MSTTTPITMREKIVAAAAQAKDRARAELVGLLWTDEHNPEKALALATAAGMSTETLLKLPDEIDAVRERLPLAITLEAKRKAQAKAAEALRKFVASAEPTRTRLDAEESDLAAALRQAEEQTGAASTAVEAVATFVQTRPDLAPRERLPQIVLNLLASRYRAIDRQPLEAALIPARVRADELRRKLVGVRYHASQTFQGESARVRGVIAELEEALEDAEKIEGAALASLELFDRETAAKH